MTVPFYDMVYKDLRHKIRSGVLRPGEQLPTDAELEKQYGLSRSPVRQVLEMLRAEGLVVRGAGRRTCVAKTVNLYQWLPGTGFLKCFENGWNHMECRTVAVDTAEPPQELREFLRLDRGEAVTHLLRVRAFYGTPMILIHNYLPREFSPDMFQAGSFIPSMREVAVEHTGRPYGRVVESLAVRRMTPVEARLLCIPPDEPQMQILRFVYDDRDQPYLGTLRYARTDEWRYEVDFGRIGGR